MADINNAAELSAEAVEAAQDGTESAQDAADAGPGVDAGPGTFKDMALSTDPSTPLDAVESPWDPERGGATRIMRAVQKATSVDGLPAIADFVIGVAEMMHGPDNPTEGDMADVEIHGDGEL